MTDTRHASPKAILRFLAGWRETQEGEILPSGTLVIDYDPGRLAKCRTTWRGADIWHIAVHIRFHPAGQLYERPVLEEVSERGFVYGHRPKSVDVLVPSDAARVELWFQSFYQLTSFCEEWDSRFGQNYWFDVGGSR